MNKLIGVISPFIIDLPFSLVRNEEKESSQTIILHQNNFCSELMNAIKTYNIECVDIAGPIIYTQKIKSEIEKQAKDKYNLSTVKINLIGSKKWNI